MDQGPLTAQIGHKMQTQRTCLLMRYIVTSLNVGSARGLSTAGMLDVNAACSALTDIESTSSQFFIS